MLKFLPLLSLLIIFLYGCNKNLTEDEKKELWSKAQTTGEIINRSGTPFNSATDKDLALSDAKNRLITGGGLLGNKASLDIFGQKKNNQEQKILGMGLPVNPYLWRASLETMDFIPLTSTDPFGGTIITDWYTARENVNERCKINIFISGADLKTNNLKVLSFCQLLKNNQWVNMPSNIEDNTKLENVILNKAKKLKLTSG